VARPFELRAFLPDELAPVVIGPWSRAPAGADGLVSFSDSGAAPGGAASDAPRWCVSLDGDPAQALAVLEDGDRRVVHSQARLDELATRLERVLAVAGGQPAAIAFSGAFPGAFPGDSLSSAEARLLADLGAVRRMSREGGGADVAQLDDARARDRWQGLATRTRSAVEAILRLITHHAWVETRVRGVIMARTAMSWTGDTHTQLRPQLTPQTARLHARSVAIAVRSRDAWGRLIAVVMQMSVRLARILASPDGLIAAMPLIWELVRSVLAEIDAQRAASPAAQSR
jgi:hypothetical protein